MIKSEPKYKDKLRSKILEKSVVQELPKMDLEQQKIAVQKTRIKIRSSADIILTTLEQNHKNNCHNTKRHSPVQQKTTETSNISQKQTSISFSNLDPQLRTIENIQSQSYKIKKTVQELIMEYKYGAQKLLNNHGYDPEKQLEIRKKLEKLQKQKSQRKIRIQKHFRRLEEQKRSLSQEKNKDQQEIHIKRARIQQKIIQIKERQKRRQKQEEEFTQFYQNYKKLKPKHQVMQQQYKEKNQRENQQKILAYQSKVKEVFKPMNIGEIQQFQEKYDSNRYQLEKQRLMNQILQRKQFQQNQRKLEDLYKGHCHQNVQAQAQKMMKKKRQALQKYERIKQYSTVVKQEHMPRIIRSSFCEQNDNEIDLLRVSETERKQKRVVKDRYLKGECQGKVLVYEKVPLTQLEQHRKGLEYLQFMKKIPKKTKTIQQPRQTQQTIVASRKSRQSQIQRAEIPQNPLYKIKRKNKSIDLSKIKDSSEIKSLMDHFRNKNDEINLEEKVAKYQRYRNVSELQERNREVNNRLVQSIQEKLKMLANN